MAEGSWCPIIYLVAEYRFESEKIPFRQRCGLALGPFILTGASLFENCILIGVY